VRAKKIHWTDDGRINTHIYVHVNRPFTRTRNRKAHFYHQYYTIKYTKYCTCVELEELTIIDVVSQLQGLGGTWTRQKKRDDFVRCMHA